MTQQYQITMAGQDSNAGNHGAVTAPALDDMNLLNLEEAAKFLRIGRCSLYQLINANKLRTVKIGGRRLVSVNALKEYVGGLELTARENGNFGG